MPILVSILSWVRGVGDRVVGVICGSQIKRINLDLSFAIHSLLPHQVSSKLEQNWQNLYFGVVRGGVVGVVWF